MFQTNDQTITEPTALGECKGLVVLGFLCIIFCRQVCAGVEHEVS